MLATVLGCVCLGIASLIYLAVSLQLFNLFIFLLSSKLNNFLIKLLTEAGTSQLVETRK